MPTYEYVCSKCDQHLEVYQSFSEEPLKQHAGLWREAEQGPRLGRDRAQGIRLLPDRQRVLVPAQGRAVRVVVERRRSRQVARTPSRTRRPSTEVGHQAGGEVRQEERHQEVGLAGPGGDGRPHVWRHRHPHSPTWCHHRTRGTPMLRRSPRTALAWAAAAVVAVVTAITVLSLLTSLRHQDEAYGALHPVAVARHDLPVGTRVTPADLTRRRIRGEAPEADALTEAAGDRTRRPGPAAPRRHRHRASPRRRSTSGTRRRRARRTTRGAARGRARVATRPSATSSTCSPPSIPRRSATGDPTIVVAARRHGRRGRHRRPTRATPSRSRCS